jgi:hypothetical protein
VIIAMVASPGSETSPVEPARGQEQCAQDAMRGDAIMTNPEAGSDEMRTTHLGLRAAMVGCVAKKQLPQDERG